MTLVLSLATPNFVLQVSDRVLTDLATCRPVNSNANKMVLYENRVAFGYTGLATLPGCRTDEWLCDVLKSHYEPDIERLAKYIAQEATEVIERTPQWRSHRRSCRLTFVGVGWTQCADNGPFLPVICRISNCHSTIIRVTPPPYDRFSVCVDKLPPSASFGVTPAGVRLKDEERRALFRLLTLCAKHGADVSGVVRLFSDAIRKVADRTSTVGKDLLVGMIPVAAAGMSEIRLLGNHGSGAFIGIDGSVGMFVRASGLSGVMRFAYLRDGQDASIEYAPFVVCPRGGWLVKNLKFTGHPGHEQVECDMQKTH